MIRARGASLQDQARRGLVTWAAREVDRAAREAELVELDAELADVEETVVRARRHPLSGLTVWETVEAAGRMNVAPGPDELEHEAIRQAMRDGLLGGGPA